MKAGEGSSGVAELQGIYGPLQILEGRVQQVWGLQALQRGRWVTRSGRGLSVKDPGRWNRGAGPDFREAVIEVDGELRRGDVKMHLYREDWWRHGHDRDPGYNRVVLHVVVFSGGMERRIRRADGGEPEEWVMGPWMREDLESVSGGEPGLFGELSPELSEWLDSDDAETIRERLRTGADRRWGDKEEMARFLIGQEGWDQGLHVLTLFVLGFPGNRRAFYDMARKMPREQWRGIWRLAELKAGWKEAVNWGMGRPANRPEKRLREYLELNDRVEDWPRRLQELPGKMSQSLAALTRLGEAPTRTVRRTGAFAEWRRTLTAGVFGNCLSGGQVDRLTIDVVLPMLAAGGHLDRQVAALMWFHAFPGPFPDGLKPLFKRVEIQVSPRLPLCNGWAQGLFWADDQLRLEQIRSWSGSRRVAGSGGSLTS
jgi:hypothetical protein